jgi:hypothetical protein
VEWDVLSVLVALRLEEDDLERPARHGDCGRVLQVGMGIDDHQGERSSPMRRPWTRFAKWSDHQLSSVG